MRFKTSFLFAVFFSLLFTVSAQEKNVKLPPNWFNLDLTTNGYFGISTEKAYTELLKDKAPKQKIIVAVIDGGTDINHEDLKDVLWTNLKEIPNNGIDDDGNGYIDDVHGWNFLGSKAGTLAFDNLELVRIKRKYEPKYKSTINIKNLDSAERVEFALYRRVAADFGKKFEDASSSFPIYEAIKKVMDSAAYLAKKPVASLEDIEQYKANDDTEEYIKKIIRKGSKEEGGIEEFYKTISKGYEELGVMLKYNLNEQYDERNSLVGDNYADPYQKNYGNNDIIGPKADHGTHVSGIIAANRTNSIGINGVAHHVSIMTIRVVPEGDERDKDVANGIRYAVDNGARIINMSFGKGYKWDKKAVDSAVKYAEKKGVLLVHAAGNDNSDNDRVDNFPNKYFEGSEAEVYAKANDKRNLESFMPPKPNDMARQNNGLGRMPIKDKIIPLDSNKFNLPHARNWLEVGASSYKDNEELKADFSNYGKYNVDVFAPGYKINSTVPGSKYEEFDGTSMAAPVVSGLAALILSYYPALTPAQVRDVIMKSVVKVNHKVKLKNELGETIRLPFADICVSGGIVNAYNALKLAATY